MISSCHQQWRVRRGTAQAPGRPIGRAEVSSGGSRVERRRPHPGWTIQLCPLLSVQNIHIIVSAQCSANWNGRRAPVHEAGDQACSPVSCDGDVAPGRRGPPAHGERSDCIKDASASSYRPQNLGGLVVCRQRDQHASRVQHAFAHSIVPGRSVASKPLRAHAFEPSHPHLREKL